MTATKVCTKCGEAKPLTEYRRLARSRDGHAHQCTPCRATQERAWREANKERIAARDRAYREANRERVLTRKRAYNETNRDQIAAYREANRARRAAVKRAWDAANREHREAYREANRERDKATARAWHAANKEYREATIRAWREANPERWRAIQRANRTKRYRLLADAVQEPYTRAEVFERDGWVCQLCGEPVDRELRAPDPGSASIDHIVPLSLGGDDTPANVQLAHFSCNSGKCNRASGETG